MPDEARLALLHGEHGIDTDAYRHAVLGVVSGQADVVLAPQPDVACPCGRTVPVTRAHQCFHCGIFWCRRCSTRHFGPKVCGGAHAS